MGSPVSIGDALLLGKIAFRLGQAFTSGRKSAPAEFREVENQLYSLSVALSALHSSHVAEQLSAALGTDGALTSPSEDRQDGRAVLNTMLDNCRGTLSHLEKIVQEYSKLKSNTDPEEPVFKRWSKKLATDIKKIKWTTEGGNLATLRSQLMVHTNSINVVLGVVNNMQIDRIEGTLTSAMTLLREIQEYMTDSLRDAVVVPPGETQITQDPPLTRSFFELYSATKTGEELLCGHAMLNLDWDKKSRQGARGDAESALKLFTCACHLTPDSPLPPHTSRLNSFSLTPLSFAVRLVDQELSWMIYKVADQDAGSQVSVIVRKLSPIYMLDFDEMFVQKLSTGWARLWLNRGMGTTLAFVAANSAGEQEVRVLNLLGDVSVHMPFVETVSFSSMGHTYSRSDIDDIQITHYSAGMLETSLAETSKTSPQGFAEIAISYEGSRSSLGTDLDDDVVKSTLQLKYDSKVECRDGDTVVTFPDIHCTSTDARGEGVNLPNGKVVVAFSTQSAAQRFKEKVQQMRAELSVVLLRLPRANEQVVIKLQASGVHTEEVAMTESDITIVRNTTNNSLRLIITSHDGRTIVSQNLAPDFMGTGNSGANFRSLTWVVHVQENGRVRKRRYPDGFNHLVLSDVRTNKLFGEWVRSQLWQASLPIRSAPVSNEMVEA